MGDEITGESAYFIFFKIYNGKIIKTYDFHHG